MKALLFLNLALLFTFFQGKAQADEYRCYMYGTVRPLYGVRGSAAGSLSDMLRMNFDAENQGKCEAMITSYCRNNIKNKQDLPDKLQAYFRSPKVKEIRYTVSEKCSLIREDADAD